MAVLNFPKWQRLLLFMYDNPQWINSKDQQIMSDLLFYQTIPKLQKAGLVKAKVTEKDMRVKKYKLTIAGNFITAQLRKLKHELKRNGTI